MAATKIRRPSIAWCLVLIGVVLLILAGCFGIIAATQSNWSVRGWIYSPDFETFGLFKACTTKWGGRHCREHGDERQGFTPAFPRRLLEDGGWVKSAQGCFIAAIVFVWLAAILGIVSLALATRRHIIGGVAIFFGALGGVLYAIAVGIWYNNINYAHPGVQNGAMYGVVIAATVFAFVGTLLLLATYCTVKRTVDRERIILGGPGIRSDTRA